MSEEIKTTHSIPILRLLGEAYSFGVVLPMGRVARPDEQEWEMEIVGRRATRCHDKKEKWMAWIAIEARGWRSPNYGETFEEAAKTALRNSPYHWKKWL